MLKILIIALVGFFSATGLARKKHKAHVHGEGRLDVALEKGNTLHVEFESPAESLVGFEHQAKTKAELKKIKDAKRVFEKQLLSMLVLAPELKCKQTGGSLALKGGEKHHDEEKHEKKHHDEKKHDKKHHDDEKHEHGDEHGHDHHDKLEKKKHSKKDDHDHHGEHSEFKGHFMVACQKTLSGSVIGFKFHDKFSGLKTLRVQFIGGKQQTGLTVKDSKSQLKVK